MSLHGWIGRFSWILILPLICQSVHAEVKFNISTGATASTTFGSAPSAKWSYFGMFSGRLVILEAKEGTYGSPWVTAASGTQWVGRTTWEQPAGDYAYFLNLSEMLRANHPVAIRYRVAADDRYAVAFEDLTCTGDCTPSGQGFTALSGQYSAVVKWNGSGNPTMKVVVTNGTQGPTGLLVEGSLYGCRYEATPASVTISPTGAAVPVSISTNSSSCDWALPNLVISWLHLSAPDTMGPGTMQVSADPLVAPQASRGTTLRILDPDIGTVAEIPITQAGCVPLLVPNPNPLNFPAAGGTGTVSLAITQGCAWTTVNGAPSWISITGGSGNTGGNVGITVLPNVNPPPRQATLQIAGQSISVSQDGACTYGLTTNSLQYTAQGGPRMVGLTTSSPSCAWNVTERPSWINPDVASGTGTRALTFTAAANTGTSARSGVIRVAGQTISVTQEGQQPCSYSVTPTSMTFDQNGGARQISLATSRSDCTWSASAPSWITLHPSTGSGSATPVLQALVLTDTTARSAMVTIAGISILVSQNPMHCTFTVSPMNIVTDSTPSQRSITVSASATACTWSVQGLPGWLQASPSNGTGSGTVSLSLTANEGATSRVATLQIGGQAVVVTQQPPGSCTYSLDRSTLRLNAAGSLMDGVQGVTLATNMPDCTWSASNLPPWLGINPQSGRGTTSISFTGQANTGPARSATVVIGGQTVTVTQDPSESCTFTLNISNTTFGQGGGSGTIQLTASRADCAWTLSNPSSWVTFGQMSGAGSTVINFSVAASASTATRSTAINVGGQTVNIQQTVNPSTPTRLVTIAPCRLVETRAEYNFEGRTGPFGPPFLATGETRTFVPSSSNVCRAIPASARAFVLNVTLQPKGPVDYVTVFPGGDPMPQFYTVRSQDGLIVANSAIVAAGNGGAVSMYASNATDVIIDISGYFTDDTRESNLAFYPLTPCRVIDTRAPYRPQAGPFGPPSLVAQQRRDFRFPSTPYCQIPPGASAYSVTLTVVPSNPLAFLTAWPAGGTQPNVSSINSPNARTLANSVILPASSDGSVSLFPFNHTDVIVDINGYFAPDDGVNGLFFYPLRQCRVVDTSNGTGMFGGPMFDDQAQRTIPIPSHTGCAVPPTARAYALNASVMPAGSAMPFLTVWPSGQSQPNASVINAFEGQTVSSGFLVPAGSGGSVVVYAFRHTHVVLEIAGYFAPY